jgi:hypothetical protein
MRDWDNEITWPQSLTAYEEEVTKPNGATLLIRAVELLPECHCGRFDLGCAGGGCDETA